MTKEQQIEEKLITKLEDLKYTYRSDICDKATLEQNFRDKFEALNRVNLIVLISLIVNFHAYETKLSLPMCLLPPKLCVNKATFSVKMERHCTKRHCTTPWLISKTGAKTSLK